jgi:hypothetical protein
MEVTPYLSLSGAITLILIYSLELDASVFDATSFGS